MTGLAYSDSSATPAWTGSGGSGTTNLRWRLASEIRFALKAERGRRRREQGLAEPAAETIATLPGDLETSWDAASRADVIPTLKSRVELTKLVRPNGIGIELGVSAGVFSELLLRRSQLAFLYSVDMYGDRKDKVALYKSAVARLSPHRGRNGGEAA